MKDIFYRDDKGRLRHYTDEDQNIISAINSLPTKDYEELGAETIVSDEEIADILNELGKAMKENRITPEEYKELSSKAKSLNLMPVADRVSVLMRLLSIVDDSRNTP